MKDYQAVEDRWPFEVRTDYPEFNTAIVETDESGNRTVIARASNAGVANRIAAAMHNCDYGFPLAVEGQSSEP